MASPEPGGGTGETGPIAQLTRTEEDGVFRVTAGGELDISSLDALREATLRIPNHALGLVLDLSEVTFVDSATVSLMFELWQGLDLRGQALRVIAPPGTPAAHLLELTAFEPEICSAPTSEQAATEIRRALPLGKQG